MRGGTMTTDAMVDRALGRAVVARCLKMGLARPSRRLDSLFSERARDTLRRAARNVSDDGALSLAVERLTEGGVSRSLPDLERTFDWLFGHSLRGRTCPYETEYGKREPVRQAHELSDIAGFYRAFGLEQKSASERCDHIACELEFLELLSPRRPTLSRSGTTTCST
jgi:TorA maturation chaperone TorD